MLRIKIFRYKYRWKPKVTEIEPQYLGYLAHRSIHYSGYSTGTKTRSTRLPGLLKLVRWHLIFVGLQCGICFKSPSGAWSVKIASRFLESVCSLDYTTLATDYSIPSPSGGVYAANTCQLYSVDWVWFNPWSEVCSVVWEVQTADNLCVITIVVVMTTFLSMLCAFWYSSYVVDSCLLNVQK
jgi:hypothetical protein